MHMAQADYQQSLLGMTGSQDLYGMLYPPCESHISTH